MIGVLLAATLTTWGGLGMDCLVTDGQGGWKGGRREGPWYSSGNIPMSKPGPTVEFFREAERAALKPGQCLVIREIIQRPDELVIVVGAKACK